MRQLQRREMRDHDLHFRIVGLPVGDAPVGVEAPTSPKRQSHPGHPPRPRRGERHFGDKSAVREESTRIRRRRAALQPAGGLRR